MVMVGIDMHCRCYFSKSRRRAKGEGVCPHQFVVLKLGQNVVHDVDSAVRRDSALPQVQCVEDLIFWISAAVVGLVIL